MSLVKTLANILPWPIDVCNIVDQYAKLQYIDATSIKFYDTNRSKYIYNGSTYYIKNDHLFKDYMMFFQCFKFVMAVINNTMCIIVRTNYCTNYASIYTVNNKLICYYKFKRHVYNVLYNNRLVIEHVDRIATYKISTDFKSLKTMSYIKVRGKLLLADSKYIIISNINELYVCNKACVLIKTILIKSAAMAYNEDNRYKVYDHYGNSYVLDI